MGNSEFNSEIPGRFLHFCPFLCLEAVKRKRRAEKNNLLFSLLHFSFQDQQVEVTINNKHNLKEQLDLIMKVHVGRDGCEHLC